VFARRALLRRSLPALDERRSGDGDDGVGGHVDPREEVAFDDPGLGRLAMLHALRSPMRLEREREPEPEPERERGVRLDDVNGRAVDATSHRDDVHFSRGEAEMKRIQQAKVVGES
jgi:hypothetical protein